jgi:hypothetical protein
MNPSVAVSVDNLLLIQVRNRILIPRLLHILVHGSVNKACLAKQSDKHDHGGEALHGKQIIVYFL